MTTLRFFGILLIILGLIGTALTFYRFRKKDCSSYITFISSCFFITCTIIGVNYVAFW